MENIFFLKYVSLGTKIIRIADSKNYFNFVTYFITVYCIRPKS